ncbi:response regulator [Phycicoccus duodecadis]|uniref:Transcriptional regulatory protein n=1 Tax=Phycicoccus duodecadis TaxID=173053 RepID=A0A2N3YLZ1_9MICO|nr:response regulator [Phycicoccus duodecadis]PKW27828.1 response regulator of citrate/malate metabolism [Phycicoccus duodecadis]
MSGATDTTGDGVGRVDGVSGAIAVLVVEDEPVAARAHATYVGRVEGFVVSGVVHTARDALRHLGTERVDLVLLDMGLPDLPGLDVVRAMRSHGHRADVMAVTSARDLALVRAAVSLGVVQYVLKPFVFATLRDRLLAYAEYRREAGEADTQAEVDTLFTRLRPVTSSSVPKGMTEELLGRAAVAVREAVSADGISAAELAAVLGVSRVTARRYAEHLVDSGRARRGNRYSGAGRPEVVYAWEGPRQASHL